MITKMTQGLKAYEIIMAIKEIEERMSTGILKQEGIVKSLHSEYESKTGYKQSLQATESAILLEASKRYIRLLK